MTPDRPATPLAAFARLPRPYRDRHIVRSTVDAFGRAHWLLTDGPPESRGKEPYDTVVVTVGDGRPQETHLSPVQGKFPRFDALPDGGFVVAETRSGVHEEHAQVFDALGRLSWTFRVGDGIEHLLADEAGDLWVGYFDEGVYGDDELSWPGLRRWSHTGEPLWAYHPEDGGGTISDCYALNVSGRSAWACAYTDFSLLEIGPDRGVRPHANQVRGANGLAVHDGRVTFFGGYVNDHDRLVIGELTDTGVTAVAERRLVRPDGTGLGPRRLVCRGPRIYVQEDPFTEWTVLDISTR
ncbi:MULTISPECIES: hypothetical protein [Streptomyces]|uniref:Uncharacterized protein n=1 Tax=Streptomyces dengpaensis TaxID=2049881 RepID=A0ABN5I081_9ACTN|nr:MULTISPECIES: hypothetical protein [Streptomyces]AVH55267.1 hypothetical protein C4B68_05095 [Streptomyces dengpaensis]PIB07365.1 hypothetical protein B1C81_19735 [Streptomyces sp. HG99]